MSAFNGAIEWGSLTPVVRERLLPLLSRQASAMAVFDSWFANGDRNNDRNLIVAEGTECGGPLRVAYLDFANTLSFRQYLAETTDLPGVPCYPEGVPRDLEAMRLTIDNINAIPADQVREVVMRIPAPFIADNHREVVLTGLLRRQERLVDIISKVYPDVR